MKYYQGKVRLFQEKVFRYHVEARAPVIILQAVRKEEQNNKKKVKESLEAWVLISYQIINMNIC